MLFLILVFFKRALWVCKIKTNLLLLIGAHLHLRTARDTTVKFRWIMYAYLKSFGKCLYILWVCIEVCMLSFMDQWIVRFAVVSSWTKHEWDPPCSRYLCAYSIINCRLLTNHLELCVIHYASVQSQRCQGAGNRLMLDIVLPSCITLTVFTTPIAPFVILGKLWKYKTTHFHIGCIWVCLNCTIVQHFTI